MECPVCPLCHQRIDDEDDVVMVNGEKVHRRCAPEQQHTTDGQNPLFRE